jgi:hypothetical protein
MVCPFWPYAQQPGLAVNANPMPALIKKPEEIKFNHGSFTFVRIRYSTPGRARGAWATDFPDADLNFTSRPLKNP